MKRFILLILALSAVAAAQPSCSLDSIRGTYAVSYIGWVTITQPGAPPVTTPGTILGVVAISLDGQLSGGGAVSGFGPVTDYDISGTIEIKPDCTGTMRLKSKPKSGGPVGTEIDRFVFNPNEKTVLATIVDLGPGVYPAVLGTWKRIPAALNAGTW
jgi:hypothetical protein